MNKKNRINSPFHKLTINNTDIIAEESNRRTLFIIKEY